MPKRGPNTGRGRAAVRYNAVKHGLRSDAPVIPELESFEEWERFRDGIIAGWEPQGEFERFLAERIASLSWRLKRVARYDTEMTAHNLDNIPDDLAMAAEYGERALQIAREESITEDKIGVMLSRRLLPAKDTKERIIRAACPERGRCRTLSNEAPPPPPMDLVLRTSYLVTSYLLPLTSYLAPTHVARLASSPLYWRH